jgi:superfamily II DNA or RNA helicase
VYSTEADSRAANFWEIQNQVVASLQTLRVANEERRKRFFDAAPWDILMVDEAHHLNADEKSGPTLGYQFVQEIVDREHASSMVFFTGTPHRGKDYGFLSLLRLLVPERFGPDKPMREQLPYLRDVMIRNNKYTVTDMDGSRLFQEPNVTSEEYAYSKAEAAFYAMLTEFIETGKAYASSLGHTHHNAVILVLIAMQKLASSSVAAIRSALARRLDTITAQRERLGSIPQVLDQYEQLEDDQEDDVLNDLLEASDIWESHLRLMEDEAARLRDLIEAADAVGEETKIGEIIQLLRERFAGRSVLLFTEYKATQSLVMSMLMQEFGDGSTTFINGDNAARDVTGSDGVTRDIHERRTAATSLFTSGSVRFLVSTEAGGEGIDLQENCHTLINVDLPWNPMRLHQRVGRLNRYGQRRQVDVVNFLNPATVESRIWEKLNGYISRIMAMQSHAMDQPEDLRQFILGMTAPSTYRELFADAHTVPVESLDDWVEEKLTAADVIDTVVDLVGSCSAFDFGSVSDMPQVDLPALAPFLRAMLRLNGRNVVETERGISFKTPEEWMGSPAARRSYRDMTFDRGDKSARGAERLLGVGHTAVDCAIAQARESDAVCASVPPGALHGPLVVCRISDGTTETPGATRSVVVGVEIGPDSGGEAVTLRDWQLLGRLNDIVQAAGVRRRSQAEPRQPSIVAGDAISAIGRAKAAVEDAIPKLELPYHHAQVDVLILLWPAD